MVNNNGPISKIYEIKVIGFDQAEVEFGKMSAELDKLKKQKQDLDKAFSKTTDAANVTDLTKKQKELTIAILDTTSKLKDKKNELKLLQAVEKSQADGTDAALQAYRKLVVAYKEAKDNSEAMEAQFGKESTQAIEAAKAFVIYESELNKINNLRKSNLKAGNGSTPSPEIPFTHNLNPDGTIIQPGITDATTAVNEFDKAQAEAAISAKEFGDSQKKVTEDVKATGPAFTAIKGSLDQYSGTLRENIKAQIENANSLAINKAAQKEIQDAIKASGSATEAQIEKLAALKEESLVLDQTNKGLTTTIRNQAKEFISASGSIEEGRAKVNQLQQAYEGLSEAERASPFGVQLKKDIDVLEPKVKELEATIGKFQRNVGNYPKNFTGAFTVLGKELDALEGKLVSGNFKGKEFDELTKKTGVLNQVTQTLNTTFKSTTAEQSAYKEAARQVGATFGSNSEVFKNFSKEVGAGNAKLSETDKALNVVSGSGNKAVNVFQKIFSGLKNIANVVPGLGLSGLILLLITPLSALGSKIFEYATRATGAAKVTEDLKKQMEDMKLAVHESEKEFAGAFTAVESLRINVDLAKEGFIKKDDVLKQYNETMGKTTGKLIDFNDIERKLIDSGPAYIQMMLLRAAANQALEAAAKKAFEAEENRRKTPEESRTTFQKVEDVLGGIGAGAGAGRAADVQKENIRLIKKRNRETRDQQYLDAQGAAQDQLKIADKFQKDAAELAKKNNFNFFPDKTAKDLKEHADRLNVAEQNAIKLIDATLKTELAVENQRFIEIEKTHTASFDEEITHTKRIEEINVNALNSKISLLSKQKHLNAEELATLADYKEKRSTIELQTLKQIQEIEKKRFADQDKELQASLSANIEQAKNAQKDVLENPDLTNIEKARATLNFIDTEIVAYKTYYNQLLELNSNYNDEALQKVRDHLKGLQRERSGGQRDEVLSTEKDIQAQGEKDVTQINIEYAHIRNSILSNEKITNTERQKLLDNLSSANNITILSKELETLNEQLKVKFQLLLKGLVSEEEYEKLHLAAINKAGDLEAVVRIANQKKIDDAIRSKPKNVQEATAKGVDKALGIDDNSTEEAKAISEAISQSFSLATDVMHNYYDAERQRIQESLALNLERLDIEEQQVKSRAQSQDEIDSIDKQYAQKKKAAQIAAGEETKKTKRAELKIALVTEIANIAVASNAYPFPFSVGIFAILSALALGRYALGVSQINAQKFEQGGQVPTRGGRFGGKRHAQGGTPFRYKGEEFEAEVDEVAIVRTRNVQKNKKYQLTGTHEQIASALNQLGGGISFSPGAKIKRFNYGGNLGQSLQAPIFVPASNRNTFGNPPNGISEDQLNKIVDRIDKMNEETGKRIERIEVVQITNSVTSAQRKQVQQKNIGTL